MKSVNMYELANQISSDIVLVGKRPGERLNEKLISEKELPFTYVEDDLILLKKEKNINKNKLEKEYSSESAERMDVEEMKGLIYG